MKNARWPALSFLVLTATFASLASGGRLAAGSSETKLSPRANEALKSLEAQLQRRFAVVDNIDFGYSRVIRPGARLHVGPTTRKLADPQTDPKPAVVATPLPFSDNSKVRQMMTAENDTEKKAIYDLNTELDGVAVYTFSLFDFASAQMRVRGPGYLSMTSPDAPKAEDLTEVVHSVWKRGGESADVLSESGWTLHIRPVKASLKACITCHRRMYEGANGTEKAPRAIGDPVGVLVIATRSKAKPLPGTLH